MLTAFTLQPDNEKLGAQATLGRAGERLTRLETDDWLLTTVFSEE